MNIQLKPDEISALLRRQMQAIDKPIDVMEFGTVLSVGDGIARVDGLSNVMFNELLESEHGVAGLALNLEAYPARCLGAGGSGIGWTRGGRSGSST
jgi:F-type H+-transporting ATPase subunit alpha